MPLLLPVGYTVYNNNKLFIFQATPVNSQMWNFFSHVFRVFLYLVSLAYVWSQRSTEHQPLTLLIATLQPCLTLASCFSFWAYSYLCPCWWPPSRRSRCSLPIPSPPPPSLSAAALCWPVRPARPLPPSPPPPSSSAKLFSPRKVRQPRRIGRLHHSIFPDFRLFCSQIFGWN